MWWTIGVMIVVFGVCAALDHAENGFDDDDDDDDDIVVTEKNKKEKGK